MVSPPTASDPNAPTTPSLELSGATVRIGGRAILDGVDLSITAGEKVALIGPSGAGKTTLLRLLGASLWPDSGTVRTLGEDATRLGGRALRHLRARVGFLRQQDNLIPPLRVAHNVLMGRLGHWSAFRAAWNLLFPGDLDRARAALRHVELEDRLWALPDELSGGERQRVAIARLVVQEPEAILADEPISALDIRLGQQVVDLLLNLATRRESTLLVSLHSLDLLHRGFDRVIALRSGQLHWQGEPSAVDEAILREVYGAEFATVDPQNAVATRPAGA